MKFKTIISLINEGYKEAQQEFSSNTDENIVKGYITKYRDLVNKNQVSGQERNIDYWRKKGFESFKNMIDSKSNTTTITQAKKSNKTGRSITLAENDKWLVVVPLDKDASCFHGKNTDWCTTKPFQPYFEQYFYDNKITLIYFIRKYDMEKWAIAANIDYMEGTEFFDKNDNSIDQDDFDNQTGIISKNFINMVVKNDIQNSINKSRISHADLLDKTYDDLSYLQNGDHDEQIEEQLFRLKNKDLTEKYIGRVGFGNFTKKFIFMALNLKVDILPYLKNRDDKIDAFSVKMIPHSIEYLNNPSDELIKYAVSQQSRLLEKVLKFNPPFEVYKIAIERNNILLVQLYNKIPEKFLPELRKIALMDRNSGRVYERIPNPTLEETIIATKSSPYLYKFLKPEYKTNKEIIKHALQPNLYIDEIVGDMIDNTIDIPEEELLNNEYTSTQVQRIFAIVLTNDKSSEKLKQTIYKLWEKANESE